MPSGNVRSIRLDVDLEKEIERTGVKNLSALANVAIMIHMDTIRFMPMIDKYASKIFIKEDGE